MNRNRIIQETADHVRREFAGESSGHDWWHIHRVWRSATTICKQEGADLFIVQLAALLHDLDDWKLNPDGDGIPVRARAWMDSCGVDPIPTAAVCGIISHLSFKGAGVANTMNSPEGLIVQDADRLDAIGAVGIGRAFAYGGHNNRMMHDPGTPFRTHDSFSEYRNSRSTTINHFHEKLLLLKDRMNTPAGVTRQWSGSSSVSPTSGRASILTDHRPVTATKLGETESG